MADVIPDWLQPSAVAGGGHHLKVLRELLERDYLHRADWGFALQDLARMAMDALGADRTLVALRMAKDGAWTAITADGTLLSARDISAHGSFAVLESVRQREKPLLTTESQPLDVDSESLRRQRVESVLAVPLWFWDPARGAAAGRRLGGCLYAHRTSDREPFTDADVALMLDIARISEPTLNLLRHLDSVESTLAASREEVEQLREQAASHYRLGQYESRDPEFSRRVLEPLRRVSHADRVGIIILGPTGSGKSYLARAYHYECRRKAGPFVTLDCAQVTSAETLTAELFGYAATSGYANAPPRGRPGKAQLAHGGTLFIDEVGSLPMDLQPKLLRLIQEGTFSPLGSSDEVAVDIQVIAATSEDLERLVRERKFREDLFWRLREITVQMPPLSERPLDIPLLAETLLRQSCTRYGRTPMRLDEGALRLLVGQDWARAGNIRGLEHTLNRSVLLAPQDATLLAEAHVELDGALVSSATRASGPSPRAGDRPGPARPLRRRDLDEGSVAGLRDLLERKIVDHGGTLAAVASDPDVAAALGYGEGPVPGSTLTLWLQDLKLDENLAEERRKRQTDLGLEEIRAAIRTHGTGSAAAKALGITRDALVHRLRKAGLSIGDLGPG